MNETEAAFLKSLDAEPGVFGQLRALFRGPMVRLTVIVYAFAIATFALGLWIVMKMLAASETRELILWSVAALTCWTTLMMIKLWIWNRINTLAILRTIHRAQHGEP
jgi:hypothetical protein